MICFDVLSNTQGCDFLCGSLPKSIVLNKVKFQGHRQRCNKTEFKKKKKNQNNRTVFLCKSHQETHHRNKCKF